MKQVLINFAAGAGLALAVLMALDQLRRANKKNQMPHVVNNAMLLSGGILAVLAAGLLIYAFTGTLVPLYIFSSIITVVVGAFYARRLKQEKETLEMWEALMAEEERQARETAEKDPANAAAWARLAQLKERRGDPRGALPLLARACELEPTRLNLDRLERLKDLISGLPAETEKDKNA
jgi:cytochrome c-type biogenesis protein CcmH/NrfG